MKRKKCLIVDDQGFADIYGIRGATMVDIFPDYDSEEVKVRLPGGDELFVRKSNLYDPEDVPFMPGDRFRIYQGISADDGEWYGCGSEFTVTEANYRLLGDGSGRCECDPSGLPEMMRAVHDNGESVTIFRTDLSPMRVERISRGDA